MASDGLRWPLMASDGLWWPLMASLMASNCIPHQVMRSMLKVIERFSMHAQQVHRLEYAARALLNAAPKRAFLTWAGMRAQVLAQRRAVVWLAVQRGHRVGTLQEMFEEIREISAVDELLQMTDELGMTPLLWASKRGFADIVEVRAPRWGPLRLMGFARLPTLSPHLPTSPHISPHLPNPLLLRPPPCPQVLLTFAGDVQAIISARDAEGSTSLHHAARRHHNDIVAMLIDAGVNVHQRNDDQSTALHWAARKNNALAIRMLIAAGADPHCKNKWGATALENAQFGDNLEAVCLLARDEATRKQAEEELHLQRKLRCVN